MNTSVPWPSLAEAEKRVLGIQTKLHNWAKAERPHSIQLHESAESRMR